MPGVALTNVTKFPADPVILRFVTLYVVPLFQLTVFGPVMFTVENVLFVAPMMICPDPPAAIVRVPNTVEALAPMNVLLEADVSVITIVEEAPLNVRPVAVFVFQTFPVPVSVQVPVPIVMVRVLLFDELNDPHVTL